MNSHRLPTLCLGLTAILSLVALLPISAQTPIPPVFGTDSLNTRIDELTRLYVPPKRIVWVSADSLFVDREVLLNPGNGQPEMGKRGMCAMSTTSADTASIILDYGRELHGGLKLVMGSSKPGGPALVRLRFGESVSETNSDWRGHGGEGYSSNDHAVRDFTLLIPSDGQIEVGNTGFRFVRIDLLTPQKTLHLKECPAIFRFRAVPYQGSFSCNDQRLNDIWMTGAYTVHVNMQEYIWDGIKRDRLIWLGDMHPEVSTIAAVFGRNPVVEESLDLACQQFPLPHWFNEMSAYSMWYLIIQNQWYMHTGDLAYLEQHRSYITGLIHQIDACIDADGSDHLDDERFLDWPSTPNQAGVESGFRALISWAMNEAEQLCQALNEPAIAQLCIDIRTRLARQVKQPNGLKQAAALMAIAGTKPTDEACQGTISPGGAQGFSTFYGYYMLEALALADRHQEAIDIIRQYWGTMLDLGATTFWEDFNLDWAENAGRIDELVPEGKTDIHRDFGQYCYPSFRHSFCHGWASGPTPWLTRHVLGVEVVEPGCRTLRITPHLGDLDWAEGTFPTPLGKVSIRHTRDDNGEVKTEVHAPEGITVVIGR